MADWVRPDHYVLVVENWGRANLQRGPKGSAETLSTLIGGSAISMQSPMFLICREYVKLGVLIVAFFCPGAVTRARWARTRSTPPSDHVQSLQTRATWLLDHVQSLSPAKKLSFRTKNISFRTAILAAALCTGWSDQGSVPNPTQPRNH